MKQLAKTSDFIGQTNSSKIGPKMVHWTIFGPAQLVPINNYYVMLLLVGQITKLHNYKNSFVWLQETLYGYLLGYKKLSVS